MLEPELLSDPVPDPAIYSSAIKRVCFAIRLLDEIAAMLAALSGAGAVAGAVPVPAPESLAHHFTHTYW